MMGKTHLQIGIAASLVIYECCMPEPLDMAVIAGGVLIGSIFPDADEVNSIMGRKLKIVSIPLRVINIIFWLLNILTLKKIKFLNRAYRTTAHRGILHTVFSIVVPIVVGIIVISIPLLHLLCVGLFIGMLLHVDADMISGKVALFLPISEKKYGIVLIPVNSVREKILRLLIMVANIIILMRIGGITL